MPGHHDQPSPSEYLNGPGGVPGAPERSRRGRTIALAATTALVAALTSGGIVYVLSGRDEPAVSNPAASGAPQQATGSGEEKAEDAGSGEKGEKDAEAKGDDGDGSSGPAEGEPIADGGTGSAGDGSGGGSGGSGGGSGDGAPLTSKKKSGNDSSGGGQGDGAAQDDGGPNPDGAPGAIPGSQPDPGKGVGGPPYLNETGGQVN